MKKLLTLICLSLFLLSCGHKEKYEYKLDVVYTNGQSEVLTVSMENFNNNDVHIYVKDHRGGNGVSLYIVCGGYSELIASDVRRYKILEKKLIEVKDE